MKRKCFQSLPRKGAWWLVVLLCLAAARPGQCQAPGAKLGGKTNGVAQSRNGTNVFGQFDTPTAGVTNEIATPAQAASGKAKTNAPRTMSVEEFLGEGATNAVVKAETNAVRKDVIEEFPVPEAMEAATERYIADALTNHVELKVPLYTNAACSEFRLRAAALLGDGYAASLCNGSNAAQIVFWLRLSATNGWVPSQVRLAKAYDSEPRDYEILVPDRDSQGRFGKGRAFEGIGGLKPVFWTAEEFVQPELAEIAAEPKSVRRETATYWWAKAKAALPSLKAAAATNDARALYALSQLHESGDLVGSNAAVAGAMLRKAAELGLAAAQKEMGDGCFWGFGKATNGAIAWYQRAATQGLLSAQQSLAIAHVLPNELTWEPDFAPAAREKARWAFEAASQDVVCRYTYAACCFLGGLYQSGLGVELSPGAAVAWLRRGADMGLVASGGEADYALALCYFAGEGVPQDNVEGLAWIQKAAERGHKDQPSWEARIARIWWARGRPEEAVKYWRKLSAQGNPDAQFHLGLCYDGGQGVRQNYAEAATWYRRAASQGQPEAQSHLATCYGKGNGVPQDYVEAVKWLRRAAIQGEATAQHNLGAQYANGEGVTQNDLEAYVWLSLAAAQGAETAAKNRDIVARRMSRPEIVEGQHRAAAFVAKKEKPADGGKLSGYTILEPEEEQAKASGTGFFITEDGFLISNAHVVAGSKKVRVLTGAGSLVARVVQVDSANDLALLKVEGKFAALPVATSRTVKLGSTVATVGFPNIGLQGFAPKLAKGEIAALSGARDDARYFQISVPVQPGNSGGALVDERGNVVGVVAAKLSARVAVAESGTLPENVNYAVKSSFLLGFLEAVPDVSARLKEPNAKAQPFEGVVKSAEQAAVLVLVY